jgi:hypothetical protein
MTYIHTHLFRIEDTLLNIKQVIKLANGIAKEAVLYLNEIKSEQEAKSMIIQPQLYQVW